MSDTADSLGKIALLRAQMPKLRELAEEMYARGEIPEARRDFIRHVSAEGLAYSEMKAEHPEIMWNERERYL